MEGSPTYNAAIAMEFFRSAGKPESIAQGETIFAENEKSGGFLKRGKMYLLLEGQVSLTAKSKVLGTVSTGEIFGEMASISQTPRSATAVAMRPCRVISLDDKQFQSALQKKPEFALMMLSLIIGRLRKAIERLHADGGSSTGLAEKDSQVFERKLLNEMTRELGDDAVISYDRQKPIMTEGQAGALMFVVLKGTVAISIKGRTVEKIGPGGVFGEMALVERSPRLASAIAETDCSLLGVNRNAFLALIQSRPEFGLSLLTAVGERARFATAQLK